MPSPQSNRSYSEAAVSTNLVEQKVRQAVNLQSPLCMIAFSCLLHALEHGFPAHLVDGTIAAHTACTMCMCSRLASGRHCFCKHGRKSGKRTVCCNIVCMLTRQAGLVQDTVSSSCGWANWVRPSRRSAGSSSCCRPYKPENSVPSPTAAPAHPTTIRAQMLPCASCFVLIVTT